MLIIKLSDIEIFITCVSAIVLFLFGLESFSKEINSITGNSFRRFVAKFTKNPIVATILGATITAFIQSSSATCVITIGLVNAGVISFKNSLPIIMGANIGTTVTAQLIAFKLTNFAPFIIIVGFLLTIIRNRFSFFGRSIFYFGFVFFTLNLISSSVAPLRNDERLLSYLLSSHDLLSLITVGAVFTAVVQSSSVTTGIIVIFAQRHLISLENAIPIIIGANIGTTITAILASLRMEINAKRTAYAHVIFNLSGVILFLPFIDYVTLYFKSSPAAMAIANIHILFNVTTSLIFLILIRPFTQFIERIVNSETQMDLLSIDFPKIDDNLNLEDSLSFLKDSFKSLFIVLKENYKLSSLALESNYQSINIELQKRSEHFNYLQSEFVLYFSEILNHFKDQEQIHLILGYIDQYEYLYQIQDSLNDILRVKEHMNTMYIKLESDMVLNLRKLSTETLSVFNTLESLISSDNLETTSLKELLNQLQTDLTNLNGNIFQAISDEKRKDTAIMLHFLTYSQRLKDKLSNLSKRILKNNELNSKGL